MYYDRALAIDPHYVTALTYKGWALDELGNHTGAIVYYDKASALDPKFVGLALSYKGAALLRLGKYSE